jgi:hypothetical protein
MAWTTQKNRATNIPNNSLPIALYDVNKKKLVGIFVSKTICCKYVFAGLHNINKLTILSNSIRQKSRFKNEGFLYTVRTANEQQCLILGDKEYIILNGYAEPKKYDMNKF